MRYGDRAAYDLVSFSSATARNFSPVSPSPLEDVVENALLGSTTWVEEMCKGLADEELDGNVPARGKLVWQPSLEQIESATAEEFGVDVVGLQAKRVRNNEARALALCLIRRLTSTPGTELAERYGGVSLAAISKAVQRARAVKQIKVGGGE